MDSELTPREGREGRDPGLMPDDHGAEPWKTSFAGTGQDPDPLGQGSREPSYGGDRPAVPGQVTPSAGYGTPSGYENQAGPPGHQSGPPGRFAPASPSGFDRPSQQSGYERPGASSGYERPAGSSGYQSSGYQSSGYQSPGSPGGFAPAAQSGYENQAGPPGRAGSTPPGYQPTERPGYDRPDGRPGYQPAAGSGYDRPAGPSGYQPAAQSSQPSAPPLPGDLAAAGPAGYQPRGQGGGQAPGEGNASAPGSGYSGGSGQQAYQGYGQQSYQPAQPGQSYQSAQPGQGYQSAQPAQGYQSAQPGQSYQSAQPGQGYQSAQPGQGYQSAQPGQGYQSAQPGQGYQSAQAYQSSTYQGAQPYQPTQAYPAGQPYQTTQTQQGYGGPWTGAPAPPRKRRRGLLLTITAVVAALIAGGTAFYLVSGKSESPTEMAMQAGQAIAPARGLTLNGTYNGASAALTVTKAGTVEGTYSQGPFPVTRLTINDVTYLKAPAGYWNLQTNIPGGASSLADGKWAKTPASDVTNFSALTPGQVSRVLEHVGNQPHFSNTTLSGTKVVKLTVQDVSYFITTSTPNRLLSMDGSINGTDYSLKVTSLTAKTIASVFSTMHADVQSLLNAVDPEAQIEEQGNGNFGGNCNNDVSCTVSVKVTVNDSGSQTVLVRMTANFSGAKNGKAFGTCSDVVPASTADTSKTVTVTPQCTLNGRTWSGWFDSHTSNFTLWVATQSEPTVNSSSDIATLQNALTQEQG